MTHFGLGERCAFLLLHKSVRITCQFPFPHPLPERFGLPDVPVFDFGRKAAEKFVLAKAGHSTMHNLPSSTPMRAGVERGGTFPREGGGGGDVLHSI